MKRLGIRHRILFAALAPAVLVAVLVTGMLTSEHLRQSEIDQHHRLSAVARQLAVSAEHSLFVGNRENLLRLLEAVLAEPDIVAAAFLDSQGDVLATTVSPQQLPLADEIVSGLEMPVLSETDMHWHAVDIQAFDYGELDLFYGTQPAQPPRLGRLLLKVSNQSLRENTQGYILKAAGIAALTLVFGILLAFGLSHGLIRTLGAISRVVAGIERGRHDLRVERIASDEMGELGKLAQGINAMAAAVGQSQEELARRVAETTASLRHERDEAEKAARARGRFFAAASHDLRQPVHALNLFIERLLRDARRSVLHAKIEQVARTVHTLQALLDTLLDYSRLDGQAYRVELRPVRAGVAIDAVLNEFVAAAAERRIALRRHVADCWLETDPVLFHRILLNLVSNAIRHTRQGAVLVACRRRGEQARIEVWDTGPGIPEEQREAIFDELVQLDNPERDANKGLGLGLAIVRRIAALLKHPVEVRSRVGKGSCFAVSVPVTTAPPEPLATLDTAHAGGSHILIIGDPSRERADIVDLVEGWGHAEVHALASGDALRWVAARGAPALAICETAGNLELAEILMDRLDAVACTAVPALLIHPGPLRQSAVRGRRRLLLPRPFRPARLRALLDHMLEPESAGEEPSASVAAPP